MLHDRTRVGSVHTSHVCIDCGWRASLELDYRWNGAAFGSLCVIYFNPLHHAKAERDRSTRCPRCKSRRWRPEDGYWERRRRAGFSWLRPWTWRGGRYTLVWVKK